jgi:hypothetical protein
MAATIEESLISEQNQYDLFYNILLSVKSKNPHVRIEEEQSSGKCKLHAGSISISSSNDNKTDMSSYSIIINREEVVRLFSKNTYKYSISIEGNTRGYSDFKKLFFRHQTLSTRCTKVIGDIYDYLCDIEEQRKISETNNNIMDIIHDISTTVDKAYRRDNKIDEVLNN